MNSERSQHGRRRSPSGGPGSPRSGRDEGQPAPARPGRWRVLPALVWFLAAAGFASPAGAGERFATVFAGLASNESVGKTTAFRAGTFDSYLLALGLAQTVGRHGHWARWEAEVQAVKHMGLQTHGEANGLVILRWLAFPWNAYLPTSVAVGDGLSYATRVPEVEIRRHGRSTRLLNYLLFEITLALPGEQRWSLSLRQHHRSGVFGLHDGVHGGSDFWGAGLRRLF
ncbi:MAG: hypothetical protein SCH98_00160 [Deferrisomatales bacterium]|nr:hypothetical protein [Deferrisomatales bacterium]